MGSFGGHALPGTLFIFYGLWTAIQSLRLYHRRRRESKAYYGRVAFAMDCCSCCRASLPWEGILKIALTLVGMCVEGVGFFWHSLPMIQHFSMYSFFLLAGIVDILVHVRAPVPKNLDYVIHCLAFLVEGMLFFFHTHGRPHLDTVLHTLLVYACFACALSFLAELRFRDTVLAPLSRAYFVLLQGTWFWQVGYILYNPWGPSWSEMEHDNIMLATILAGWHMFLCFCLLIVLCALLNRCYGGGARGGDPAAEFGGGVSLSGAAMSGILKGGSGGRNGAALIKSRSEEDGLLLKGSSSDEEDSPL